MRAHFKGQELARAGRYPEALERYLWAYDHGRHNTYVGARSSFLLGDIVELGRRYPPAIAALEARRKIYADNLLLGLSNDEDAWDVASLDMYLGRREDTVALCIELEKRGFMTEELRKSLRTLDELWEKHMGKGNRKQE